MPFRGTAVRSTPALVHSGRDEQAHAAPATCAGATHSANTSIAWRAIIDASLCGGQRLSPRLLLFSGGEICRQDARIRKEGGAFQGPVSWRINHRREQFDLLVFPRLKASARCLHPSDRGGVSINVHLDRDLAGLPSCIYVCIRSLTRPHLRLPPTLWHPRPTSETFPPQTTFHMPHRRARGNSRLVRFFITFQDTPSELGIHAATH